MATVIAFSSGKGGVGKTNISTNLGLSLVARNLNVCLFDADTGLANINILLGISPSHTIQHVLNGQKSIEEIIITLPSGISIVPAASGIKECTNLTEQQNTLLTKSLQTLEKKFDYLLIDTAAGIDNNVIDFVASAQYRVIIITSEPTSLTDSFALLKMLVMRKEKKSIFILVNRVEDYQTSQLIFKRFQKAVKTYLKIDVHYLGYLTTDPCVNKAVTKQTPVVASFPDSSISCGLASLADIIKRQFKNEQNFPHFSQYWANIAQNNVADSAPITSLDIEKGQKFQSSFTNISSKYEEAKRSHIYGLLKQDFSESQLKGLMLTLESIYEIKPKTPFKDIDNLISAILAEANKEKIKKLHLAIAGHYEQQLPKRLNDPIASIKELSLSDQFSKDDFNQLMKHFENTYQQRFKESYFSEGNMLLTQIQQLVSSQ